MLKLTTSSKPTSQTAKKYCRLVLEETNSGTQRFVETKDGTKELRIGIGKKKNVTPRVFRTLIRSIIQSTKQHKLEHIAIELDRKDFPKLHTHDEAWFGSTLAENLLLADYEFTKYKSSQKKYDLKEVLFCNANKAIATGLKRGETVGEAANTARDIANTPAEDMTPSKLANAAKVAMKGTGVKVTILDTKTIKKLKMGLLEAVGKGASDGPKCIVLEYSGGKRGEKPVVLIGKGITYDSGGMNMKPVGGLGAMQDMHMDMSGGAGVIGAMRGIAKLKVKKNVVVIIPAAENAVSEKSMRAGDIVTSMSGKTVEVLHTDAEGRMVLADALTYTTKHFDPKVILDCATLTGAALVALGQQASALMSKHEKLQEQLLEIGEESGDYLWPLPLWSEYEAGLKGDRGDYTNVHKGYARWGGCIEGGTFLSFFAPKNVPWAHIDMAPRMSAAAHDKLAKGATGEPVRMLVRFVEKY